jgi:DUF971 family protein
MIDKPRQLDLDRKKGLTVIWQDGRQSFFSIEYLRKMSPSADAKQLREEMAKNPLTVLPGSSSNGPLEAESAEMVGNYALRIRFNDGHDTGLYSWDYLKHIDPDLPQNQPT